MTGSKTRADPKGNRLHTKGIYHADHGTYIDSVLREIYDGGPQTMYRSDSSI